MFMMSQPQPSDLIPKPRPDKRLSLSFKIVAIIGTLVEIALILVIIWILATQGFSQAVNILTTIATVIAILGGIPALILAYFQWYHPKSSDEYLLPIAPNQSTTASSPDLSPAVLPPTSSPQSPSSTDTNALSEVKEAQQADVPTHVSFRWEDIPHIEQFCGRSKETSTLRQWIMEDQCRLVAVLGIGGIGKTTFTAKFAEQVKGAFVHVLWHSLQNAPPLEVILKNWVQILSDQQRIDLPTERESQIRLLITYLQKHRCLVILDNMESILQSGHRTGQYREGYEDYGTLIELIGEVQHRSCLLLTSREKPKEVSRLEGKVLPVRSLQLLGLTQTEGQEILKPEGLFGSDQAWTKLINFYAGNPLALKLISEPILDVFDGNIDLFLKQEETVGIVGDIHNLLEQQFNRLSEREREIIYWLAIEREAVSLDTLWDDIIRSISKAALLEDMNSLRRRFLVQTESTARFTLQPVIMEYVTDRLIDTIYSEIETETSTLLESHALIKAQAKDYVRNSQVRLILKPLAMRLFTLLGTESSEQKLSSILSLLRKNRSHLPSYAAGNVLNILIQLGCN